jgi:RNA polymerase-binding transcription factor DksA
VTDQQLLASARRELESERDSLQARLGELDVGDEKTSMAYDDNFADSAQVAAEQGEAHVLASQLREQLADVDRALRKLEDGTYGKCERCGEPISDARLEAMPATRFCINHA